uniref:Ubiquitin-like domain-containing protein n=1 Tax=Angiostrongylus cantonensis TaxID=6313 RepID=A0A158PCX1_ANGCA
MSDCGCEVQIDVPAWVPGAIAFTISVAVTIAVCITYILQEMERHKNFYGREDKFSTREQPAEAIKKEEMDTYALGRCSDELVDVIGRESPILGSRTKRAETLTMLIKNRLEKMIGHNFIIYASLDEMKWTVKGLESLKDNVEEMHLQMRLSVDAWNLKIMAFKLTEQGIREKELLLYAGKALRSGKVRPGATLDTGQALSPVGRRAASNNDNVNSKHTSAVKDTQLSEVDLKAKGGPAISI